MKFNKNLASIADRSGRTVKYVAVAFGLLVATLLSLSIFSFFEARNVQQNYSNFVSDSLNKLQLITNLNHNEDAIYNTALAHLITADPLLKHQYEQDIKFKVEYANTTIRQLDELLQDEHRLQLLNRFKSQRSGFYMSLDTLLTYSRQGRINRANNYNSQTLTPAYQSHQLLLSTLSNSIRITLRDSGNETVGVVSAAVTNFTIVLILAFTVSLGSAIIIKRVFKRLKRDNLLLSSEIQERQQLEKALSESQREYKMLFDNNPVPMWLFDQHSYRFLEVNESALQEYGFTRQEFLEKTILDIRPPEDVEPLKQKLAHADRWSVASGSWRHMRKNGSFFQVETRSHAMPEQNEVHPRLVVSVNTEDREQAIRMLERREKQLREVSSSIPGAVFQLQQSGVYQFEFTFVSEGVLELCGLTPATVCTDPMSLFENLHPSDRRRLRKTLEASYNTLVPLLIEFRLWQQQLGKWKWIRGHGLPTLKQNGLITWNGTMIDITNQKEAQDQLAKSEANLRALLDSAPQSIYLLDAQLNVISFNAAAAAEVKAMLLKELQVGDSILEITQPDLVESTIHNHARALAGETVTYETGRGDFWYDVSFRPVMGKKNKVLAVSLSIQNISEQKQVLESIIRSEAQLARAQQLAHLGNWEYDVVRDTLSWSDGLYEIYRLPKTFIPTFNNILDRYHPDDRETVLEAYTEAVQERKLLQVEHRMLMANGEERVLYQIGEVICDEAGKPILVSGSTQDITDRRKAQREVLEAKNMLQSTLENIPEIIFSADPKLSLTYISPQCFELTGYREADFVEQPSLLLDIMYEQDHDHIKTQLLPQLLLGHRQQLEVRVNRQDNEVKWLLLRFSPMKDETGLVVRIDGSAADMTQYKLEETKRKDLTDELLKQNQNLQQFAYIVSHNLRAPIANILGLTSIYNKKQSDDLINHKVIDNLCRSANLLDSTIRDLNDILTIRSELNKVQEEISFKNIFDEILGSVADNINEADIYIDYDFAHAPRVRTVKSYVHSIMLNLVTNALKYRSPDRKLQLRLKTFLLPHYICLSVSDNGLGIDLLKEKEKVFGLYKRFHPKTEGKGIGLHLVKTQAELLGGKVEVESQVNVGTTFNIYFKN